MGADDEAAKVLYILQNFRDLVRCFPRHAFREEDRGAEPDYASLDCWAAHPGREPGTRPIEDANWLAAPETELQATEARPCDCFFVHDTTMCHVEALPFLGVCAPRWNAPMGSSSEQGSSAAMLAAKVDEQTDLRLAACASTFSSLCRIYAPRYRQATIMNFLIDTTRKRWARRWRAGAEMAFNLAYGDVRKAFETFADDPRNADRPFILAGHSQGAKHLARLLQEEVEQRPDRLRRFVHAYHAGHVLPMDLFKRTLWAVRPSRSPEDVCSVSSWRSGRSGHTRRVRWFFRPMKLFYADRSRYSASRSRFLGTNPVTWSSDPGGETSEPEQHLGAVWPLPEGLDPRDHSGLASSLVNLRFGHLVARSRGVLGAEVRRLVAVPVDKASGEGFRVHVDEIGTTRVPAMPRGSLAALAERDILLYHDLDFALFHRNIRENAALRYRTWLQQRLDGRHGPPCPQSRL